jgi:hypothetical protein
LSNGNTGGNGRAGFKGQINAIQDKSCFRAFII